MEDDTQTEPSPAVEGRGRHFGGGMIGGQVLPSQSLQETAARYNAETPKEYESLGSPSGTAADQYDATMGGLFPVQNGASSDTYASKKYYPGALS